MDLQLSAEQKMTKKMVRELAIKEIAPVATEIDETGRFPREIIKKMADAGLFSILIPPEFGGAGGDRLNFLLAVEEIAAVSASVASIFVKSMCTAVAILNFGNSEQQRKYLPAMARGEKLGAFGQTETGSGANWLLTLGSKALPRDNHYLLHGAKCFISNAGEADIYVIIAITDKEKGPQGISALILEKDTPGLNFGTREQKLGLRATPTGEIIFEACQVPKENLLGPEGGATKIIPPFGAMVCSAQAAIAVGLAQAALDASIKFTKERVVVEPKALANFDNVQCTIADMAAAVEAARLMAYRSVLPGGSPPLMLMAATFAETMAVDVTGKAITLHGRYGCAKDFPLERYFRDAKTLSLHPVLDVLRLTVGKILLGLL